MPVAMVINSCVFLLALTEIVWLTNKNQLAFVSYHFGSIKDSIYQGKIRRSSVEKSMLDYDAAAHVLLISIIC